MYSIVTEYLYILGPWIYNGNQTYYTLAHCDAIVIGWPPHQCLILQKAVGIEIPPPEIVILQWEF